MKKFLLLASYLLLLLINSCEDSTIDSIIPAESNFEWAISCAGNSVHGRDIFVDYEGNVYVIGSFFQEVKFDSITIQTNASSGSFLVKFSPDRNFRWIKYVEMPNSIYSVSTDMLGNIVISGKFTVTQMNSDYLLNIEQNSDVIMLNSNGEKIWETNTEGYITNLYIGNNDQIITTSVDYESVIDGNYEDYNYNKFIISKISNSGSIVLSKEYHYTSTVYAHDIKLNSENEIYITGTFGGTFDLGVTDLVSTSAENFFLMKLDANANCKWAKSYGNQGTVDESDGYSITVDQNNQIIVYGTFEGDINIEGYQLTTNSSPDMMLCKYTNDGQIVWVHNLTGSPRSRGIMVSDDMNYLYLSNGYSGEIKFKNKTINSSQASVVVAKLDTDGNLIWAEQAPGQEAAFVLGLCVDKNQNAYITGDYQQKITFGNKTLIDDENTTQFFIAKVKNH